ncbi:hypothetical protein AB0N89_23140 [Amycolatopsis sp. NPDC089917]|uniref:hypothetical protein n=1 Tax=Amycolatopsis sp. NPDC089917 TaxID=3155187 RepID=UPI0034450DDD
MNKKTWLLAGVASLALTSIPAVAQAGYPACWGQLNIAGRDLGSAIEWGGLYTCQPVIGGDYDADWTVSADGAVIRSGKFQPAINDTQTAFPVVYVDLPNPAPLVSKHVKVSVTFNAKPPSNASLSTERDVTYDPNG